MPTLALPAAVTFSWLDSPLGPVAVYTSAAGVCAVELLSGPEELAELRSEMDSVPADAASAAHAKLAVQELAEYFAGERTEFTVPVVQSGTLFQRSVWAELSKIPYGETRSYDDIARALGKPAAVRAVGQANGRNHVAVMVPCHRVVNKGGGLGGYGGGLWRKQLLLDLERRTIPV